LRSIVRGLKLAMKVVGREGKESRRVGKREEREEG
jgi:hypothetical protein